MFLATNGAASVDSVAPPDIVMSVRPDLRKVPVCRAKGLAIFGVEFRPQGDGRAIFVNLPRRKVTPRNPNHCGGNAKPAATAAHTLASVV